MDVLNQTLLTLWGYPLSVLELVGVLTGFSAVFMASKAWAVNFLFGMINAAAYFMLYFECRLYSMMMLQIAYFTFSIYGFYHWRHPRKEEADTKQKQRIGFLKNKARLIWLICIFGAGALWGWGVIHFQYRFPEYFDPPAYPWLDAILTMASLAAQFLLSRKIWDNWLLWVVVDVISSVLYASMGLFFTAILYGVFTLIALKALFEWKKIYETYERRN
jgi:nicotinamide mononucleotide transporter